MVQGDCTRGLPLCVEDEFHPHPLRMTDPRVIVGRGITKVPGQARPLSCRLGRIPKDMPRREAPMPGNPVIEQQPHLYRKNAALRRTALAAEKSDHRIQRPGENGFDRYRCWQLMYHVRCVDQQCVPLRQGFPHKSEFTVLKVPQPAVDHPGRCGAAARAEVVLLDQQDREAVQCQLAEDADAVNAATHDNHVQGPGISHLGEIAVPLPRHNFPVRRHSWRRFNQLHDRAVLVVELNPIPGAEIRCRDRSDAFSQPRQWLSYRQPTGEFARPLRFPVPARRSVRRKAQK